MLEQDNLRRYTPNHPQLPATPGRPDPSPPLSPPHSTSATSGREEPYLAILASPGPYHELVEKLNK